MSVALPPIGLGTGPSRGDAGIAFMAHALQLGYRLFDTASHYHNEREVGEAVRASGVPRDEIVVLTKVWPDMQHAKALRTSSEASLKLLGLDRIDLLVLHWPNPMVPLAETIGALNAVKADGLAREIGVSNFPSQMFAQAQALSEAPLIVNEVEYHPFLQQKAVLAAAEKTGTAVIAHCPLGRVGDLFGEPVVAAAAARLGRSPAQVVLRWHVQQGLIPIPGTTNRERLAENFAVFDFALDDGEMADISALGERHYRICAPPVPYEWDLV